MGHQALGSMKLMLCGCVLSTVSVLETVSHIKPQGPLLYICKVHFAEKGQLYLIILQQ